MLSQTSCLCGWTGVVRQSEGQFTAAHVCGLPYANVSCHARRIGGGFGGKETRPIMFSTPAAVAALAIGRPISLLIERDVDMAISGQRHSFHAKYTAGCSKNGELKFLDIQLYCNAGFSFDVSESVMGRAVLNSDSAYKWLALRTVGHLCKTNQPSHTAFRGFGTPQSIVITETVIEHLATELTRYRSNQHMQPALFSAHQLRTNNLYKEGDELHYGQVSAQQLHIVYMHIFIH